MAVLMLVSLFAVCASTGLTAADERKSTDTTLVQAPPLVGGPITSGPTTSIQPDGSIDRFAVNSTGIYHKHANGAWKRIGNSVNSEVAAVSTVPGRVDALIKGNDGDLYWATTTNNGETWTAWQWLGEQQVLAGTAPAVSRYTDNEFDLFWVNATTKALMHKYYHVSGGQWTGREVIGGVCTSTPAAATTASAIHVLVRGTNGLWDAVTTQGGVTWSWTNCNEQLYKPSASTTGYGPVVTARDHVNDVFDVFWVGSDRALYHKQWDPTTSTFVARQSLGGAVTAAPTAIYNTQWCRSTCTPRCAARTT